MSGVGKYAGLGQIASVEMPRARLRRHVRRWLMRLLVVLLGFGTVFTSGFGVALAGAPTLKITVAPLSVITDDPLTWAFKPASPASCQLTHDGTTVETLADCTSPVTYDESSQSGGNYVFTVYAAPAGDVTGSTPKASSTVGVAPVSPRFTSTPATPGTGRAPAWSFTLPTGATGTCELDNSGGTTVQGPTPCTSSFTANLVGHPDDDYTLNVTASADDVDSDAASSDYTLDTFAAAPTVTPGTSTGDDHSPTFTVTGTESGATVTCTATGPDTVTVSGCASLSPMLDLTGQPDGTYQLSVVQTDRLGNVSAAGTASFALDTSAPAMPTVTPASSMGRGRIPTFAVSDTDTVAGYVCSVNGPDAATVTNCGASTELDITGANGAYTLSIAARNSAGNVSAVATATYDMEATPPTAPVITGPTAGHTDTATFGLTDAEDPLVTYQCTVTGPSVVTASCGATTTMSFDSAADGFYTLTVTATDGLDQVSTPTARVYEYDTAAPSRPTVTGPTGPSNNLAPSFTVSDTDADPLTYQCSVTPTTGSVSNCGATTTLSLPSTGGDGPYTLSVKAVDPAGNVGSAGSATYVLDRTPPPAPTVVSPTSPSNVATPVFQITEDAPGEATPPALSCVMTSPSNSTVLSGACPADGTFDLSTSGDGVYTLVVTATDVAGNTASTTSDYTLDTVVPPTPTVTPNTERSNNSAPVFSATDNQDGTPIPGLTLSCTVTPVVPIDDCASGTPTLDLSGASEGTYTLRVLATDGSGNVSAPATATYTYDVTPPPAPDVTASAPSGQNHTVTFTVVENDTVPGDGVSLSCSVTAPATTTCPAPSASGDTATVTIPTVAADGPYVLTVTASDMAGNMSTGSDTYVLKTSNATPVVTGPTIGNDPNPDFTISGVEAGDTLVCTVTAPDASTYTLASCAPGSVTLPTRSHGDGNYTLAVQATDAVGNVATGSATYDLVTTTTAPTVTAPSSPSQTADPAFTIGASFDSLTCSEQPPTGSAFAVTPCSTGPVPVTTTADGTYTLTVTATDALGNTASTAASYILDTTPPPSPVVAATPALGKKRTATFTVSEDDSSPTDNVSLTCSAAGADGVTVTSCPAPSASGGLATVMIPKSGADGPYVLTVTATDAAGNASSGSATYSLKTSTIAPVVAGPTVGSSADPVFAISGVEAGDTLTCDVTAPDSSTYTLASCGPGAATLLTSNHGDGVYTLAVTATDSVGNSATGSATYDFVSSTTAPTVTAPPSPSKVANPIFTIGASTDTLTCSVEPPVGPAQPLPTCAPGSVTVPTTVDGLYILVVDAQDAAGNTATAQASYVLDTTAPPGPVVTAPDSPALNPVPEFTVTEPEAADTLTCQVSAPDGTTYSPTTCGTSVTVQTGSHGDGNYVLTVTATDPAGNASSGSATYTLENSQAASPVLTPSPQISNQSSFSFSVTTPLNPNTVTASCQIQGLLAPFPASTCTPTTVAYTLPSGADDAYVVTLTLTDINSDVNVSGQGSYKFHAVMPSAPTVALQTSSPSKDTDPTWAWSDFEAGYTLTPQCFLTNSATGYDQDFSAKCGSSGVFTTPLPTGAADGDYTLHVLVKDAYGNVSRETDETYVYQHNGPAAVTVYLKSPSSADSNSPSPTWSIAGPAGALDSCVLTNTSVTPNTTVFSGACPASGTFSLAGQPNGVYELLVTSTDVSGIAQQSAPSFYTYDTIAPSRPRLIRATSSPSTDPSPVIVFSLPSQSTGHCVWSHNGQRLSSSVCAHSSTIDLSHAADGTYQFQVVATDAAGNVGEPLDVTYVLDRSLPGRPDVSAPHGNGPVVTWAIHAASGNSLTCRLVHAGATVSGPSNCSSHPSYNMSDFPQGVYVLEVTQTDEAGGRSLPGEASYFWQGVRRRPTPPTQPTPPVVSPPPSSGGHPVVGPKPNGPRPLPIIQKILPLPRKVTTPIKNAVPPPLKKIIKKAVTVPNQVARTVQNVVSAVGKAGGGTGFPLLLLGCLAAFLIVQNRIDRRDPKLAFASVAVDDMVEFLPPPSRGGAA